MNRRIARRRQIGSVTFWAWMTSIALHAVVLTAFAVTKFSRVEVQSEQRPVPTAQISQIKKLMQASPVAPKPKIRKLILSETRPVQGTDRVLPPTQILVAPKPGRQDLPSLAKTRPSRGVLPLQSSEILPHRIEFFGSWTDQRKICYLVDCSGSMQGLLERVRRKLKESIASLQPDQYFYIIFFGNDKLFEFGDGQLVRATEQTKSAAYNFVDSVQPAGQTNAMAALQRAVAIRDSGGINPSVIYFLTDGFELTTQDVYKFPQQVANLLERFAPTTKINVIAFWPRSEDRKMLETITKQTGGELVLIADDGG